MWGLEPAAPGHEDAVEWIDAGGKVAGVLRFRFRPEYVRERIVPDYFSHDFPNPDQTLVVRVTDEEGRKVFENAPTPPEGRFEVSRDVESSPSLDGLRLSLRYRDLSIEQDVRRWEMGTLALIGFIDLMLGAGLFLVYSNVRREAHLSRLKSDFVANVSHELKTPLALIRLFAETLELRPRAQRGEGPPVLPGHQQGEPAPHPAHQQHPRLLAHRGRAEGVPVRARQRGPDRERGGGGLPVPDRAAGVRARRWTWPPTCRTWTRTARPSARPC